MSNATRLELIPPHGVVFPPRKRSHTGGGNDTFRPEELPLYAVRSLLTNHNGRPVPIVGTCGYGTWHD